VHIIHTQICTIGVGEPADETTIALRLLLLRKVAAAHTVRRLSTARASITHPATKSAQKVLLQSISAIEVATVIGRTIATPTITQQKLANPINLAVAGIAIAIAIATERVIDTTLRLMATAAVAGTL
jgi:hypothetical protein